MYLKVEGTGGGSAGSGIGRIEVYDLDGQLVPLTKADVIATNVNQRTGDANYLYLFQKGSSLSPPPYGPAAGIYYIIKLPEGLKGFSKIFLENWGNGSYYVANISISISENNSTYEQIYLGAFAVSEKRDILQNYTLLLSYILFKMDNKLYSLNANKIIETYEISIDNFKKYGSALEQNLDSIFLSKSYVLQNIIEAQFTQKPLSLMIQ